MNFLDQLEPREHLGHALKRLASTTRQLRVIGQMLVILTALNITLTIFIPKIIFDDFLIRNGLFLLPPVFCILVLALWFESLRKYGDGAFDELSDELHASKSDSSIRPLTFEVRMILRMYSKNKSLPLIPGDAGPGIIVALNTLFVIVALRDFA